MGFIFSTDLGTLLPFTKEKKIKPIYEPCRGKTGLRGFRPGQTQTGLYIYRLESSHLGRRGIVLGM